MPKISPRIFFHVIFNFLELSIMSKKPVRVAVTGAAGQIGYALLFRIASGEMLGKDQPIILQLLEVPVEGPQKALKGVIMEIEDCAFPLLAGIEAHGDPMTAFKAVSYTHLRAHETVLDLVCSILLENRK